MAKSELVILKTFLYRPEAELEKNLLSAEGIEAIISADDCGGYRPDLAFGMGCVRLLVHRKDYQRAREVLNITEE